MAHTDRKMSPLYLTEQERYLLDFYANVMGISRQKLLEEILATAFEDLELMDKTGFLVSDIRLADQFEMFKKLSRKDIDDLAKRLVED